MKIASYNLWSSNVNFYERLNLLIEVLKKEKPDLIAFQEVKSKDVLEEIASSLGMKHLLLKQYSDSSEGLGLISNYELEDLWTNFNGEHELYNSGVTIARIKVNGLSMGITNVHLDYKKAYNKEMAIVSAVKKIKNLANDYDVILGDFNSYPESSIHMYLTGKMSLMFKSTNYTDLFESVCYNNDLGKGVTLDYQNNPRWDKEKTFSVPARVDWIMLRDTYPHPKPTVSDFKVIGNERVNDITPSDHYGVICNVDFD